MENSSYNILYNIKANVIETMDDANILDSMYLLGYRVPTEDDLKNYDRKNTEPSINNIIEEEKEEIIEKIKKYISKLEYKMPLYDVYTSNIYLINRQNIFKRVTYNHYRFPSKNLVEELEREYGVKKNMKNLDVLDVRRLRKYELMIEFIKNFNIPYLQETYYRMIYKYSEELGKNIIFCKRPSFNKYIHNTKPYYTTTEIINLGLNMGFIKDKNAVNEYNLNDICRMIRDNDINYRTLLSHQRHIIKKDLLGLTQYYTVQGSFFINNYLRKHAIYQYSNVFLDDIIIPMWKLCLEAPAFDNDYILYRFVSNDDYMKHLKPGEIFYDEGFMSTTRDPFYKTETYQFGFILVKIRIPKGKVGVALCVETVSHFPQEQEILFPPKTRFKLINRDSDTVYYHTDAKFGSHVKTRYEFEWVGNSPPELNKKEFPGTTETITFLDLEGVREGSLEERIKYFCDNHLDSMNRFNCIIDGHKLLTTAERYNSLGAYKDFYAIKTANGFSMYAIYNNYLLFMLEIGEVKGVPEMHVNFYVKYNSLDKDVIMSSEGFVKFISTVAYYFGIRTVAIYMEYKPCAHRILDKYGKELEEQLESDLDDTRLTLTGNYCLDFYKYFKQGKRRFWGENINRAELQPFFTYYDLDILKATDVASFINRADDEIYQLYVKSFNIDFPEGKCSEFFVWLVENKCYLIEPFITKLERIYKYSNPFKRDLYVLNPFAFLYNRNLIKVYGGVGAEYELEERSQYKLTSNEYRNDRTDRDRRIRA